MKPIYLYIAFTSILHWSCGKSSETETVVFQDSDNGSGSSATKSKKASACSAPSKTTLTATLGNCGGDPAAGTNTQDISGSSGQLNSSVTPGSDDMNSNGASEVVLAKPIAKFAPADIYFNLYDNCGRCHDWVAVEVSVKAKADDSLSRIRSGNMPKNVPNWQNTTDGKALITYLESVR